MKHKIRLQMRKNRGTGRSFHCVYQIQIPIRFIKKLGWKKGYVLVLNSPSASPSISIRKRGGAHGKT
jgi:hypothetical protein